MSNDLRDGWVVPVVRAFDGAPDPLLLLNRLDDGGDALLLESGRHHPVTGRYSFLAFAPRLTVRVTGGPLPPLRRLLAQYRSRPDPALPPFTGGFAGYISYEARHWFERLPRRATDDLGLPWLHWALWEQVVAIDHLQRRTWVIANAWPGGDPVRAYAAAEEAVERLAARVASEEALEECVGRAPSVLQPQMTQREFERMVRRAQEYIRDGDIYQANLSQRFSGPLRADPRALYGALRAINPSPFACFARLGGVTVAGCSPERLLRLRDGVVETRPIAGTRPRGATPEADVHQTVELILSEKERAEHLMLVDLERNDLGRVCDYGSVRVDDLMTIEDYSHVFHIVSNVRGRLRRDADRLDLLAAVFPGGTITGTPKVRAMGIIDALEPVARGLYTGSIGYAATGGAMDWNILIRTFLIAGGQVHMQVGSGIVADSDPACEYEETLAKGAALMTALRVASSRPAETVVAA